MIKRKRLLTLLAVALVSFVGVANAKLAANRIAANRIASNGLAQVSDGAVNDVLAVQLPDGTLLSR